MREGWIVKSLGEVGKVSMCKRVLKKQTNTVSGIPFYKIGTFGKEPNAYIDEKLYLEFKEKYSFPKKGDILLSASGTIGRRVVYDGKPAYFQDSNIVWIDNNESEVLNEYLYKFYGYCEWGASKGATISRLYNDDLRRIQIPVPPLEEQKQIVAILDEAFEAIDQAKTNIEKNIENAQELLENWTYLQIQNSNWKTENWEEVCSFIRGPFGGSLKKSMFVDSGYAVYEQKQAIHNDYDALRYFINEEKFNEMKRFEVKSGDLLMSCSGVTLGRVSEIPKNAPSGIINQALLKLRTKKDKILNDFLVIWMRSKVFQDLIFEFSGGAAQPNVPSVKILKTIKVPCPTLSEQLEFINHHSELNKFINDLTEANIRKVELLENLKKSLLEQAFAGTLTHKDMPA